MADEIPGIHPYHGAAGGWDALKAVADALRGQEVVVDGVKTLLLPPQYRAEVFALDH